MTSYRISWDIGWAVIGKICWMIMSEEETEEKDEEKREGRVREEKKK